jgi:hypothetical protein
MTKHRRKVGRPKKKPGEPVDHRLTPKMKSAIEAMIEDGLTIEEAAKAASLTPSAIYKAMRNPPAREFYVTSLRALIHCTKHLAVHSLIKELSGNNAAARVAAARTLLEDNAKPVAAQGLPQIPGFSFLVVDARSPAPLPNGHAAPAPMMIEGAVATEES